MRFFHAQKGFALVETIMYVGIIAVMSVFIINMILSMFFAFANARDIRRLTLDGTIALERITREIRLANAVNGTSVFDIHPSSLALASVMGSNDPTPATKEFLVINGRIAMRTNGNLEYLVSPQTTTSLFIMRHIKTARSEGIKIEFTIERDTRKGPLARSFYTSVILRGSYE